jgi:hypothetical protein
MQKNSAARKWFGAVVAALTLTMVASVAPASGAAAAERTAPSFQKKDSGWGPP